MKKFIVIALVFFVWALSTEKEEVRHCWYSAEQAKQSGSLENYAHINGKPVRYTEMTPTKEYGNLWKDARYLGECKYAYSREKWTQAGIRPSK